MLLQSCVTSYVSFIFINPWCLLIVINMCAVLYWMIGPHLLSSSSPLLSARGMFVRGGVFIPETRRPEKKPLIEMIILGFFAAVAFGQGIYFLFSLQDNPTVLHLLHVPETSPSIQSCWSPLTEENKPCPVRKPNVAQAILPQRCLFWNR